MLSFYLTEMEFDVLFDLRNSYIYIYSPIPNKRVYTFINSWAFFPLYTILLGYTRLLDLRNFRSFDM